MPAALQAAAFCIIWPAVCVWLVLGWTGKFRTSEPQSYQTWVWMLQKFPKIFSKNSSYRNPQILQFFRVKKVCWTSKPNFKPPEPLFWPQKPNLEPT